MVFKTYGDWRGRSSVKPATQVYHEGWLLNQGIIVVCESIPVQQKMLRAQ